MTVGELRSMLCSYDDDTKVMFKPENSDYVENFGYGYAEVKEVSSFWGSDYEALILESDGQGGMV